MQGTCTMLQIYNGWKSRVTLYQSTTWWTAPCLHYNCISHSTLQFPLCNDPIGIHQNMYQIMRPIQRILNSVCLHHFVCILLITYVCIDICHTHYCFIIITSYGHRFRLYHVSRIDGYISQEETMFSLMKTWCSAPRVIRPFDCLLCRGTYVVRLMDSFRHARGPTQTLFFTGCSNDECCTKDFILPAISIHLLYIHMCVI